MDEELTGGNMNIIVRIGDTVRRPSGPWTKNIHALLEHVRHRGVTWVPRAHGMDDQGREVLDFLPGEVPTYPLPSWVWGEDLLVASARAMRQFHDATVDFVPPSSVWRFPSHGKPEVICHNDFAPYNFVCRNGEFVGLIDFDTASPGSRLWDLAYLAYRLVPLASPDNVDAWGGEFHGNKDRRFELLLQAYDGKFTSEDIIRVAVDRLMDLARFSDSHAIAHDKPELAEHAAIYRNDAAYLRSLLVPPSNLGSRRLGTVSGREHRTQNDRE